MMAGPRRRQVTTYDRILDDDNDDDSTYSPDDDESGSDGSRGRSSTDEVPGTVLNSLQGLRL